MNESTKETKPALTLIFCALAGFVIILSIYSFAFGGNPLNRIHFALFASLIPALLTIVVIRFLKPQAWWPMALTYFILFIAFQLIWAVAHG
jgi:hypothetical protein